MVLLSAVLTLLACEPTATATPLSGHIPEATEVSTPVATQTPEAEGDGGDEVTAAVQQLFDTRRRALRDDDAELLRSVMTRDLAESCELDELQSWLDQDENSPREVVVRSVFVDVSDPKPGVCRGLPGAVCRAATGVSNASLASGAGKPVSGG